VASCKVCPLPLQLVLRGPKHGTGKGEKGRIREKREEWREGKSGGKEGRRKERD